MKKLLYGTLVLALVGIAITFSSCEKNTILPQNESSSINLVTLRNANNQSITMLEFESNEEYDKTIEMLEQKVERLEDAFVEKYKDLNDEDLNAMEEKIGYNDRQALIDFVKSKQFNNSMLFAFIEAEERWLNNDVLDEKTAPSNLYVVEEAEMALLNEKGEVKIAGEIIKITPNGVVVFSDASVDNVVAYNDGKLDLLNTENVSADFTSMQERSSSDCHWWKAKTNPRYYSDKKVRLHRHFHKYPWKSTSLTRIGSYKKNGSKWKRFRTKIGVENQSYFMNKSDCNEKLFSAYDIKSVKKRKYRSCRNTSWGLGNKERAKNGESVIGTYIYPSYNVQEVLYW
ncbi:MAG: hypothetical protein ISP71_05300 [Flavobacteriales bacterium]|nr:hypothetical protein [Flavobacteriales bacterium]